MWFLLRFNALGTGMLSETFKWMNAVGLWVQGCSTAICGTLISRVLCKDIKDVTNPNWKAAAAIRETAISYCVCLFGFWYCTNKLIYVYGLWSHMALAMNNSFSIGAFGFTLMANWGWYQYLLFTNRRSLEDYSLQSSLGTFLRKLFSKSEKSEESLSGESCQKRDARVSWNLVLIFISVVLGRNG